ncbi:MAG: DEAD/DEAH box helicase [Myxococcota bacterium]|jgi:ATP-dependent RNA helicase DeaD|nr:DEAD/DEAH box helicase [Myxococcota bacterium]
MTELSNPTGPGVTPAPVSASLEAVPKPLEDAMRRRGFDDLTLVQRAVLAAESDGRDLRISSQTGSGKTVAIGLGLADHLLERLSGPPHPQPGPSVLILVPTRELAMQVREEFQWLFAGVRGLRTEVVMGGTSVLMERKALARNPQIVVGTPGRTLDHIKGGAFSTAGIEHVALDESDRMLDMGFRDELEAILEKLPAQRRTHLISATFPSGVRRLADRFQKEVLHIEGTRLGAANADIEHTAHLVDRRDAYAALVNLLLLNEGGRCLIFVERRMEASSLATKLSGDGFPVQPFSGELPQAQRTRTLNAFRDGTIRTLVSTDVAARGIDIPNIELVIHMDPPGDADSYVHRSGRTGRAGQTGKSVMLAAPRIQRQMTRLLGAARIEMEWAPAPGASKVNKQLRKRFRHEMHQRLSEENQLSQAQLDYAKGLLDGRDPAAVVAHLLELAQPKPKREPMEVREPKAGAPPSHGPSNRGFTRFSINWGEASGATTNRILGHVCRRGQIKSPMVGAIEIGSEKSTFDVDANAAARFEKLVKRRDPRDPNLRIVRTTAGGRSGETARPKRSGKPAEKRARGKFKKPFNAKKPRKKA